MLRNPATGRYFQATPRLYLLAASLDGRRPVSEALARLPPGDATGEDAALLEGLAGMIAAGLLLLPGAQAPRRGGHAAIGAMGRLVFTRFRLGDLGPAMPVLDPLLGWLYSRRGAVVLCALLGLAAIAWSGRGADLAEQFGRYASLGVADLAVGYLLFIAAKLLHEGGHAVAARRMAAAEGERVGAQPWGISFMFLMPAPFVDASSAWFLENPRRRAAVGAAGVVTDLLVAALAAVLWANLGPGEVRDRLFDLVVICGVSSLLFNLNPLMKLDGYYILSDLTGMPNLMQRAQAALGRMVFGPFGLAEPPVAGDLPFALYAFASWAYRWTVYLAVFWLAGGLHWLLAGGVATLVAVMFLGLPLWRLASAAPGAFRRAPGRASVFAALASAAIAAVLLVPLPRHIVAEGVVVRPGLALVYARTDGRIVQVARAGPAEGTVLQLDNPETERLVVQLRAEAASLAIEARRARAEGAGRIDIVMERERAVARQIEAIEAERATWLVAPPTGARWEPLRAEGLQGAWVRRDDSRPLGAVLTDGPAEIRLVLDQWDGPAALAALAGEAGTAVPLRPRGGTAAAFTGRVAGPPIEARDLLPSPALATSAGGLILARIEPDGAARPLERVFELRLIPKAAAAEVLRHGARVQARIALPAAPLAQQAWRRMRQALQRRLAV